MRAVRVVAERLEADPRVAAALRPAERDPPDLTVLDRERALVAFELGFPAARRVDDPDDVRFAAAVEPRAVDLGLIRSG